MLARTRKAYSTDIYESERVYLKAYLPGAEFHGQPQMHDPCA